MTPLRLTRRQSREIDRIAIEEFGIAGIVLMENAARSVLNAIEDLLIGRDGPVSIVCGPGDNGGDGLALARHLRICGNRVAVVLAAPPARFRGDAAINLQILLRTDIPCKYAEPNESAGHVTALRESALIIDAMFGTGLARPPGSDIVGLIDACEVARSNGTPVVSIDLPSGLDCDSGRPLGEHCIRATRTITMATEKAGFDDPASRDWTGDVVVANIGVPREIIDRAAGLPG